MPSAAAQQLNFVRQVFGMNNRPREAMWTLCSPSSPVPRFAGLGDHRGSTVLHTLRTTYFRPALWMQLPGAVQRGCCLSLPANLFRVPGCEPTCHKPTFLTCLRAFHQAPLGSQGGSHAPLGSGLPFTAGRNPLRHRRCCRAQKARWWGAWPTEEKLAEQDQTEPTREFIDATDPRSHANEIDLTLMLACGQSQAGQGSHSA